MIRTVLSFSILFSLMTFCACAVSQAQDYISPDQYYRPVTTRDLDYRLDPDMAKNSKNSFGSSIKSFSGGCPDEINIGGIGNDVRVIGSVDIEVNIDKDFVINCGK